MEFLTEMGAAQSGQIATRGAGDENEFSANDINQGAIGNCYLLAALMALADTRPDVLRNAIQGPLADGSYNVRIHTGFGDDPKVPLVPKVVNVSPNFYVNKTSVIMNGQPEAVGDPGELTFARGGDRDAAGNEELWVKLIEKAFAAEAGSYANLDAGFPAHVLEALTGERNQEFWFNGVHESSERDRRNILEARLSDEELSEFVVQTLDRGMPIATTTYEGGMLPSDPASLAERERYRISPLHAYGVLEADADSILLRNPHGREIGDAAQIDLTWQQFRKYFKELSTATAANS